MLKTKINKAKCFLLKAKCINVKKLYGKKLGHLSISWLINTTFNHYSHFGTTVKRPLASCKLATSYRIISPFFTRYSLQKFTLV